MLLNLDILLLFSLFSLELPFTYYAINNSAIKLKYQHTINPTHHSKNGNKVASLNNLLYYCNAILHYKMLSGSYLSMNLTM